MEEIVRVLKHLKEIIPEVKELHTGVNFSSSASAFDVGLVTGFESIEDLEQYRNHPEHRKIVERIRELVEEVAVVDFKG